LSMTTMKSRQETEARSIAEQAAEWLLILEDEQPENREAFAAWLARSPLHVGAFLRASAVDSLLNEFGPTERIAIDTALFKDELPDVVPMERAQTASRRRIW